MSLRVEIVNGPLSAVKLAAGEGTGALVVFDGVVRGTEAGRPIRALDYQVYEPMATKQLDLLAQRILTEYGLLGVSVWHSNGLVGVGKASFRLVIEGAHRQESLEAMGEFIERMKRDVPIWKKPVYLLHAGAKKGARAKPPVPRSVTTEPTPKQGRKKK